MILLVLVTLTFIFAGYEAYKDGKDIKALQSAIDNNQDYSYALMQFNFWQHETATYRFVVGADFYQKEALRNKVDEIHKGLNEWFRTGKKPECLEGIDFKSMRDGTFVVNGYNDLENKKIIDERLEQIENERKQRIRG